MAYKCCIGLCFLPEELCYYSAKAGETYQTISTFKLCWQEVSYQQALKKDGILCGKSHSEA